MSHSLIIDEFVHNTESFVAWIETPPIDKIEEASSALLHLSKIYSSALQLMKVNVEKDETEEDPEDCKVTVEEWKEVYERLNHLPFTYYREVESPHDTDSEEVYTDLVEDLTDIYQDLAEGLKLYKSDQHEQALCHWQMTFEFHWGRHLLGAMKSLHCYFQEESDFEIFQKK